MFFAVSPHPDIENDIVCGIDRVWYRLCVVCLREIRKLIFIATQSREVFKIFADTYQRLVCVIACLMFSTFNSAKTYTYSVVSDLILIL